MLALIFLVFALVCFILSAAGINHPRANLQALGLAFIAAYFLVGRT